ncbi:MAG: hypothetical protein ABUS79_27735 [Pseudomonadota bacterium]
MSSRIVLLVTVATAVAGMGCSGGSATARQGTGGSAGAPARDAGTVVDTGLGPWTAAPDGAAPAPPNDVTVYAFSQTNGEEDPQVLALAPDMNIRAWQRWDRIGANGDFSQRYVADCHAVGTRFVGGTTATALFPDEVSNPQFPPVAFDDLATRDASDAPVIHSQILPNMHRGSLAHPAYRDYLVRLCESQIDLGVDGLFFDEINADYQGATYDNNEGFDAAHLADFNAYLLWRFPGADYQAMFGMAAENLLRSDVPAGDLTNNFNYQRHLVSHGWSAAPFAAANPLATVWGRSAGNRPAPGAANFVDTAEPYRYWGDIAQRLRSYAQQKLGRPVVLTANGVWPLVDFQSVGLYEYNQDGDGGVQADYVPVAAGSTTAAARLDGTRSLQRPFLNLKARSAALAPGAPVVLFIDWPTSFLSYLLHMPPPQQQDYWRIYPAEAYANGLFFAFFLRDTVGDPTAMQLGWMPLFQTLTRFYRDHRDIYHGVTASTVTATTSLTTPVMIAVSDQGSPRRRLVHLVNHDYDGGLKEHGGFTVTVAVPAAPTSVSLASPDLDADVPLVPGAYASGNVTLTVPSLVAYDIVEIAY